MSSLLTRAGDAIRNSPLMQRHQTNYSLAKEDEDDPFAQGITFHVDWQGCEELPANAGKGDQFNSSIIERVNVNAKPPFRKFSVVVTDKTVRLKDLTTKQVVDLIPIYNISFCGSSTKYDRAFSLIVKNSDTGGMRCLVMQAADKAKAQAMIKCVSKAFNIAFLSWQAKDKHRRVQATVRAGTDSPRARRKMDELRAAESKTPTNAPAAAAPAPVVAAPVVAAPVVAAPVVAAPVVAAPVVTVTQEMGAVSVSEPAKSEPEDDLEDAFTNLAKARSHPDLLDTDYDADPSSFNWLEAQKHADPGSTSNLLDI